MRIIPLFIFAFTCLTLQAQDFSVEVLDTTIYGLSSANTFYGDIDLYNNLGSGFSMTWERIEESVPAGWETSNCDPEACRAIGVTSQSFMLPTSTSGLNAHFYPNGIPGSGYMKVKLSVSANPADSAVLTYYGVAGTVGIKELEASDIQVFPSPAQTTLNILLPHPGEPLNANIYNMSGQLTDSFRLNQGNLNSLDVSKLQPGVYMIHFDQAGNRMIRKKFVKL